MSEYPILFSTPMVQANLEDRKTNTRRLNGLDKVNENPDEIEFIRFQEYKDGSYRAVFQHKLADEPGSVKCPYGKPGDLLWVRETHQRIKMDSGDYRLIYKTDPIFWGGKWKPSIHMPKTAARIWLQVEEIRVERLQDISWNDAIAEGIHVKYWAGDTTQPYAYRKSKPETASTDYKRSPIEAFQDLWTSINGNDWNIGWNANPWVWVVKYKVLSTIGKPKTEPG